MGAASEAGQGSMFWFEVVLQPDPAQWEGEQLPVDVRETTVLVIDPNPLQCAAYQAFFDRHGIQGECVSTLEEGWSMIDAAQRWREPYQVVIAEFVSLQSKAGELGRRLGSLRAQSAVVMTAIYDGEGTAESARRLGADEYLVKPFRNWELVATLSRALKASRAHRSSRQTRQTARKEWAATRAARRKNTGTKTRVLLAEDNVVNQTVARRMLENLGCRVDVAENGREAVDLAQRFVYAVMFVDCEMPGMDGFEATQRIRADQEKSGDYVPIVAMTANAMEGDRERCLAVGMDDFLAKPVTAEQLGAMVRHWLGRATIR